MTPVFLAQGWKASFTESCWRGSEHAPDRWITAITKQDPKNDPPVVAWSSDGEALIVNPRTGRLVVAAVQPGFIGLYYTPTTKQPVYRS